MEFFLQEVLERKNFSVKWIGWIMAAVTGGKVAINLNGEVGNFFRIFKGLRQGDPLSPLLFNIVGDALSEMLNLAKKNGVITGLVPHLVEEGITHLQYADDTILFLENTKENVARVKFLLFCFEEMFGLRINYNKSEAFGLGMEQQEQLELAQFLNCKVGVLPLKYLGIPVSNV